MSFTDGRARLDVGHVLDVLASYPAGFFHTLATSPPYWALRAYGTNPQVWGGDPTCPHVWTPLGPGPQKTGGDTTKQVSNKGSQAGNGYQDAFRNGKLYENKQLDNYSMGGARCLRCPAWLGELGSEPTIQTYVANMLLVGQALWRVLRPDGTLWLNLGDTYATTAPNTSNTADAKAGNGAQNTYRPNSGLKPKDLIGIPWRVALALQDAGWYLRAEVIWAKPNPMPESITDRPSRAHETIFLFSKQERYYYDAEAVREPANQNTHSRGQRRNTPSENAGIGHRGWQATMSNDNQEGRNLRSVWSIPTQPMKGDHYATFPEQLVARMILAGTSAHGCCSACGAPWQRLVERSASGVHPARPPRDQPGRVNGGIDRSRAGEISTATTGWQPTCACSATIAPCRVLDPFAGSGTTLYVARGLGRDAWGIELNAKYARDAWDRIRVGSAAASRAGR